MTDEQIPSKLFLALLSHVYSAGYARGHHRTVEGRFVQVLHTDAGNYFLEEAGEVFEQVWHSEEAVIPKEVWENMVADSRRWKFVASRFDRAKMSASQRIVEDLKLGDGPVWESFKDIVDEAIRKSEEG